MKDNSKIELMADDPNLDKQVQEIKAELRIDSNKEVLSREEMSEQGSTLSEPESMKKDLEGNQNLSFSNGVLKPHVVSARGSFAMLHDHPGPE